MSIPGRRALHGTAIVVLVIGLLSVSPGIAYADTTTASNTSPIAVPGTGTAGTGSPYPSSITISGLAGTVTDVNVTLAAVTHTVGQDMDVLLVGPAGQNLILMSDAPGPGGFPINGTITFDDNAASTIPNTTLGTGTFKPTNNNDGTDTFPAPAPTPSSATTLATFNGTNPNGVWSLYTVDDATGDVGQINGGWSIAVTTATPTTTADAGGPYTVAEGSGVTLNGTGSTAGAGATFAWDVDNDGQFDDATGANPTLTAGQLAALGLGDGPAGPVTVSLRVTDGAVTSVDTTTLTVTNVAPTASIPGPPSGVVAGVPTMATFAATDPSTADTTAGFTYAINWGDGTSVQSVTGGSSVTVAHTYAASGTFTLTVTATDKDAGTSAPATVSVPVGAAPVADAGGPYTVAEGASLALAGGATNVGAGAIFAWDLDNDGQFDDATGANPTLTASQLAALGLGDGPTVATISLRVTDGAASSVDSATVTVTNVAPVASIPGLPSGVTAGVPTSATFAADDPSAADDAAGFTYAINWGDGTPVQSVTGGSSVTVAHTYAANGTFTLTVTATDKDGATSAPATATVTVGATPSADAGGPYTVAEGSSLTLNGSAANVSGGATFAWDVDNDGQFDDATGANPTLTAGQLATLGLGDGPAGPVTVSLRVTDGATVLVDTATLTVTNVAPTASVVSVPSGVVAGTPANTTFGADDPAAADDAAGFTYAIDWGDGTPVQSVTGGATVTVSHTWAANGTFTIAVTATDKDGGTSAPATAAVTVGATTPALTAEAGGPYSIAEGDNLVLAGSASGAGPGATFAWDLDNDGQFDDATGATPTLTATQLAALGLADGPAGPLTIRLRVTDGAGVATDTATYSISNRPPAATIVLPASIVAGNPPTVKVGAVDPSPTDQAAQFQYRIDWDGDGTVDDVVTGAADPTVNHTYVSAGVFNLTVVAVDKDGAAGSPTVVQVTVQSPGGSLPRTGSSTGSLILAAVALIMVGALLAAGTRFVPQRIRRRRDQ